MKARDQYVIVSWIPKQFKTCVVFYNVAVALLADVLSTQIIRIKKVRNASDSVVSSSNLTSRKTTQVQWSETENCGCSDIDFKRSGRDDVGAE